MTTPARPPIIYNLFPRHFSSIDDWTATIPHVSNMGFNWIYVNPFHETGWSGSLYAVKDYYKLNPILVGKADLSDMTPLRKFAGACRDQGLQVMMDLVVNHTAFDCVLVQSHPAWYRWEGGKVVSPSAIDPADARKVTVWGDLAEIDNEGSKDREGLWQYWNDLVAFYQSVGFTGFRCDAAYQVPVDLWRSLIRNAKQRNPDTLFIAETLGCRLQEIDTLRTSGFDYLFNSSKYWYFDKPWCIEQHRDNAKIAPSISFPESHDTPRLAAEQPGTIQMQKGRYVLAAVFSEGVLMPAGYQSGAVTRMDVVKGSPKDIDSPKWDLSLWIRMINDWKKSTPPLNVEGSWKTLTTFQSDVIFLEKSSAASNHRVVLCINKDWNRRRTLRSEEYPSQVHSARTFSRPFENPDKCQAIPRSIELDANEIVAFWDR